MKIYLAARYGRREELCVYRAELEAMGHTVQARWLNGEHQIGNDGKPIGEHGEALVEGVLRSGELLSEHEQSDRAAKLRASFAADDWEDVNTAECVVSFTERPRAKANRGGRHVEFGIALANRARVIVVGHRENIFHWLPQVEFCTIWEDANALLLANSRVDIWSDPNIFAALKSGRTPYDIAVLRCPECGRLGYYNQGSSFRCRICNLGWAIITEDEDRPPDHPYLILDEVTTLADATGEEIVR